MPDYYQPSRQDNSNLKRLKKYLLEEQVAYIDLYEYFQKNGRVLYHKTDSHWNNEGAALAAGQILDGLGREHASYEERPCTSVPDRADSLSTAGASIAGACCAMSGRKRSARSIISEPSEQTGTQPPGEHDGKKTEIRREDYPDCDGSGHGYREIYYSDGSVVIAIIRFPRMGNMS